MVSARRPSRCHRQHRGAQGSEQEGVHSPQEASSAVKMEEGLTPRHSEQSLGNSSSVEVMGRRG